MRCPLTSPESVLRYGAGLPASRGGFFGFGSSLAAGAHFIDNIFGEIFPGRRGIAFPSGRRGVYDRVGSQRDSVHSGWVTYRIA